MRHDVELRGCSPEPLMSYLKAIGILRLVNEQKDPEATGWWRRESFTLRSELDRDALVEFFLKDYRPTPIVTPWAGGSGFFPKDDDKALRTISASGSPRFEAYRAVIDSAQRILRQTGLHEKPDEATKTPLLRRLRREMPDCFLRWMDAAMVLEGDNKDYAPVLGSGGNDGRLDFSRNFMERLVDLGLVDDRPAANIQPLLNNALFGEPTFGLGTSPVGQFAPGRAGGPNATQGLEGKPLDNPWDFVLMLEGALMLAGAAVRRYGAGSAERASFPFTVQAMPVGSTSASETEVTSSRGELWLPLWERPTTTAELGILFGEGRAELAGRPARDALQFAQAVATLGVDRGISSFVRYGFFERYGRSYLAAPMERFRVPEQRIQPVDLVREIDVWLDRYRQACGSKSTPARYVRALRRIDSRIFDLCRYGRREEILAILAALGRAERELAVTRGQRSGAEFSPPLSGLSPRWVEQADDGSIEFELAASLAGLHAAAEDGPGTIRQNLEPVRLTRGRWGWSELAHAVVWTEASLVANLSAVLERRLMDALRTNCDDLGLSFRRGADLESVSAFLAGEVDEERLGELLWGLVLVDHRAPLPTPVRRPQQFSPPLPRAYALLKLLFLPRPLVPDWDERSATWRWRLGGRGESGLQIRPEPGILALLRAGRLAEACRMAYDRLRASGLIPLPGPTSSGVPRASDWEADPSLDPQRLAAALLIPVSAGSVSELVSLVTRSQEDLLAIATHEEGGFEL
jgi:CRISPR-associated protein Csx17